MQTTAHNDSASVSAQNMRVAQRQARLLAPLANAAVAPVVLAAAITGLVGREFDAVFPLDFRAWVYISLYFVPAIVLLSMWQAGMLTNSRPMHPQALTGLSLTSGMLLSIGALAMTLALAEMVALGLIYDMLGLTPELAALWLLRLTLVLVVLFIMLFPSFMIAGAVMGLVTGAVVHAIYNPAQVSRPLHPMVAAGAGVLFALLFYGSIQMARSPAEEQSLPTRTIGSCARTWGSFDRTAPLYIRTGRLSSRVSPVGLSQPRTGF